MARRPKGALKRPGTRPPKDFETDYNGRRFGRLVVIGFAGWVISGKYPTPLLRVKCDCGTVAKIRRGNIRSGATRSCGCILRDLKRKKTIDLPSSEGERRHLTAKSEQRRAEKMRPAGGSRRAGKILVQVRQELDTAEGARLRHYLTTRPKAPAPFELPPSWMA